MSRQEAAEQYSRAQKRGRKSYKSCILRGRYPYPQVLDEILEESMTAGQVELGLAEIPLDQIVGTKTEGRRTSCWTWTLNLPPSGSTFARPTWGTRGSGIR